MIYEFLRVYNSVTFPLVQHISVLSIWAIPSSLLRTIRFFEVWTTPAILQVVDSCWL